MTSRYDGSFVRVRLKGDGDRGPEKMTEIFIGSFMLSVVHVLIPVHWMPIAVIGKSEGWKRYRVRRIAALAGLSHSLSTIFIGVGVGLLGMKLATISVDAMRLAAPGLFLIFGIVYVIAGFRVNAGERSHGHVHGGGRVRPSRSAATTAILVTMFFTPCIEIETYFFRASIAGWSGIALVGVTYVAVTVVGVLLLVDVVRRGLEFKGFRLLERFEKQIMGFILVALAFATYFFFHEV